MKEYRFHQVDVFTDRPFAGNPLAVFPDAGGLTGDEMQALAREMNLSETTFVLPTRAAEADFRVRILTPRAEVPFAGHPVVGTHWVLAHLGRVRLTEPMTTVRFELGVGVLPADLHVRAGRVERVVMTQGRPRFLGAIDDWESLACGLGLPSAAVRETGLPVEVVSTGVAQITVPVRSLSEAAALDPRRMDTAALSQACQTAGAETILVFARETVDPKAAVHVRVFAPLHGIPEDPATGSATGGLGAYLVRHRLIPAPGGSASFQSEQGLEMGRPSELYVQVDVAGGEPTVVRVGGRAVAVLEGIVRF
jgi:trans-2,3-dihydro-3-hydroxyanthranilate isomerase